jgi:hypothetical protein
MAKKKNELDTPENVRSKNSDLIAKALGINKNLVGMAGSYSQFDKIVNHIIAGNYIQALKNLFKSDTSDPSLVKPLELIREKLQAPLK